MQVGDSFAFENAQPAGEYRIGFKIFGNQGHRLDVIRFEKRVLVTILF